MPQKSVASKGKQVDSGKRKITEDDTDKFHRRRQRKNPGVLQFFDNEAGVHDDDDSDDDDHYSDDDFMETIFGADPETNTTAPEKTFIFPKEEMEEEEFDIMMEERYMPGSKFVRHADDRDDDYEAKRDIERDSLMFPSANDPILWKVKCMAGRERYSTFCLMQKFVDMQSLGTKLNIVSTFTLEHVRGFIFIEADKECEIIEACKGLSSIYATRLAPVPRNEMSHLLSVRNKKSVVSAGTWARVKSGNYKGDLTHVVAVNEARRRATIKLVPRIDLQLLMQKFGGGVVPKRGVIPASRLISTSELEEFRPLIQLRNDRETGKIFQILDGMMLKDGYLYKRTALDSLSFIGVMPKEDELLKFRPSETSETDDSGWLTQLYGERKKKQTNINEKGCGGKGEKGEGSSGSGLINEFELFDLVCFGQKFFGLVIGIEKDDRYKILKDSPEGSLVVTVEQNELKSGTIDMKFTAFDHNKKPISVNDTVRVVEGPSKDKQGIARQIYRGVLFIYDENETENGGYFCCKSQMCEKVKLSVDLFSGKDGEGGSGASGFDEFNVPSPKSPLSPKKTWQPKEDNNEFNKGGQQDGTFSIGQTLRIRIGPLKGYLCRVIAIRYSDVTVKLDSKQKVLTVKSEHLTEVRAKSSVPASEDPSGSFKPFDLLGSDGGSKDGDGTAAEGNGWNIGGGSWPSNTTSTEVKKDEEGTGWGSKVSSDPVTSWGTAAVASSGGDDPWNKGKSVAGGESSTWGKAVQSQDKDPDVGGSSWGNPVKASDGGSAWGKAAQSEDKGHDGGGSSWGNPVKASDGGSAWGKAAQSEDKGLDGGGSSWGNPVKASDGGSAWGKAAQSEDKGPDGGGSSWGNPVKATDGGSAWGKAMQSEAKGPDEGGSSWGKQNKASDGGGSSWGNQVKCSDEGSALDKQDKASDGGGSSWGKPEKASGGGGSSWGNKSSNGGSAWDKQDKALDGGGSSWGNKDKVSDGGSSWDNKALDGGEQAKGSGGSSWGNKGSDGGGSSWGGGGAKNQDAGGTTSWDTPKASQDNSPAWGASDKNQDSGDKNQDNSSWGKKSSFNSGSSWGANKNQDAGGNSNQDSGWGQKSNWNSGSGDANNNSSGWAPTKKDWSSGNDDQTNSGSWRGGGSGSDRGSYRGRGGDRGGFRGGRGGRDFSDGGGFRGRGGDRGGFRGRGRDGGSDRGGFRGRGGDRGGEGFGGRGRGRRDWNQDSGDDNNNNDQGGGWKTWGSGSGGNNNQSGDGQEKSWGSGGGGKGWGSGSGTGNEAGDSQAKSWGSGGGGTGNQAAGWGSGGGGNNNQSGDGQGKNWGSGSGAGNQASDSQGKSWGSGGGGTGNQAAGWGSGSGGTTNQTGDTGTTNQGGGWGSKGAGSSGDQPKSSSWGKGNDENSKGGW
ncbi:hypothetical protein ACFE04_010923 [Oxalis oulophora]